MKTKIVLMLALVLCMSALYVSAYAAITVNAELLTDEMIHINVNDSGSVSSVAVNLNEHIGQIDTNNPYISVQAVNSEGNQSDIIQVRNPLHTSVSGDVSTESEQTDSSNIASGPRPFTPSGTGTIVDNATDGDGKEFFTIFTEDGNEFFLIIDRHRSVDNVYLLNTVTEQDLISLARQSGNEIVGTPVVTPPFPTIPDEGSEETPPTNNAPSAPQGGGNRGATIFIIIAALLAGGVGYYFKIVRPKQQNQETNDFYDEDEDYGDDDEDYVDVGEEADDE